MLETKAYVNCPSSKGLNIKRNNYAITLANKFIVMCNKSLLDQIIIRPPFI